MIYHLSKRQGGNASLKDQDSKFLLLGIASKIHWRFHLAPCFNYLIFNLYYSDSLLFCIARIRGSTGKCCVVFRMV